MNTVNGWSMFEKSQAGASRFEKYTNRLTVMFPNKKNKFLYLSPAVYDAMGKPEWVAIMTRGSNVGLVSADSSSGYKVMRKSGGITPYITIEKFYQRVPLQAGAYDVHMEAGGVAVFDSQGTPSRI